MTDKTKEFLQKLKESGYYNEGYDYSEVVYLDNHTPVTVVDTEFGIKHLIRPSALLQGTGCTGLNLQYGYLLLEEARKIVNKLNLKKRADWKEYCKSGEKPTNIPSTPDRFYKNKGWVSWGDWLGNGSISSQNKDYLSFEESKKFVHSLNLKKRAEWKEYCNSGEKPDNITASPRDVYKNQGWLSWGDWLGTRIGYIGTRNGSNNGGYLPFEKAREIVHGFHIESTKEWREFSKSNLRPNNIPSTPSLFYKNKGWVSTGDWLGTGIISNSNKEFLPFEEARNFAHGLNLLNRNEWVNYCKKGKKPANIPSNPRDYYLNKGWVSMPDWLGTQIGFKEEYLPFEKAREFVHTLCLINRAQWKEFCQSGDKPTTIPSTPSAVYKHKGWVSMPDWLGTQIGFNGEYLPFEKAREIVHRLGLNNVFEWEEFCKGGDKPYNIPTSASHYYNNKGWLSWGDWLGYIGNGKHNWSNAYMINFITSLETELNILEAVELITIINSNNLAKKLKKIGSLRELISTHGGSQKRKQVVGQIIQKLKELDGEDPEIDDESTPSEFEENLNEGNVIEIKESMEEELVPFNPIKELKIYDNKFVIASLDDENIDFLLKNQLKKIWNKVLNDEVDLIEFKNEKGERNFNIVKNRFFYEYGEIQKIDTPKDYIFRYQPNLMQKLVSYRLINERSYGNWSGTGAGKTLSAIFSGRLAGAKNTLIICNNSTVEGWVNSIHEYFENNKVYTKRQLEDTLDSKYIVVDKYAVKFKENENNYLVLNYETFQLGDGDNIVSELLKNNRIDYIILDEVQNVKQRKDDSESIRRNVVNKLIIHSKEKNKDLLVMVMSATPIINNLTEPKKLIELLTGDAHGELETKENIINGIEMYKALTRYGLRYRPNYNISVNEEIIEVDGSHLSDQILEIPKGSISEFEKVLLKAKLDSIKDKIQKGTLIYTHYVTELSHVIGDYVNDLGFSIGYYIGEDKNGLRGFKNGTIDVLIGSAPIGTGVDGIQYVCNTLIPIILPWTSSEYDQLVGRINRQGSKFDKVNIYIPQVIIPTGNDIWSWDKKRHNIIKFKATLADLALDGRVPKNLLPPKAKLMEQAKNELSEWVNRLKNNDFISFEREKLKIPLNPLQLDHKRKQLGDFSELNKSWSTTTSKNTHDRLRKDPSEWYYYHSLYSEKRKTWAEIPYIEIAKKIKGRPDWVVADFGCGENLLSKEISNMVHAFDHIAIEDNVVACDMKNVPLDNDSIDAAIFSLSLMGSNYPEYIKEAYRILKPYGNLFICEPSAKWEGREERLKQELDLIGFKIFESIINTKHFIYIDGIKIPHR